MTASSDLRSFGIGDPILYPKVQVLKAEGAGVDLAVIPAFTFRIGQAVDYLGETGLTLEPQIAASRHFDSGLGAAINLGYRARDQEKVVDLVVDDEIFTRLGVHYDLAARGALPLGVGVTVSSAVAASAPLQNYNQTSLEALGHLSWRVGPTQLYAAAGKGLAPGFGTPDWRALVAARLVTGERATDLDPDSDGIAGDDDTCPEDPEDLDSFEDSDGCPDRDNDKDGILDGQDRCPMEPEDKDSFKDEDGCPELDNDADGVVDTRDNCPAEPEDKDQFEDENGCPDPDNDQDGLLDANDRCPNEPEDKDGLGDEDGCPEKDFDQDTFADEADQCPRQPETFNGTKDKDGCPDGTERVALRGTKIEFLQKVYFDLNKATVKKQSLPVLDDAAALLKAHPEITRVRVEGHTDNQSSDTYNQTLSQKRVDEVKKQLVKRGVAADRVEAVGYGETRPIATNDTEEGRALNRRVEIHVIEVDGKPVEASAEVRSPVDVPVVPEVKGASSPSDAPEKAPAAAPAPEKAPAAAPAPEKAPAAAPAPEKAPASAVDTDGDGLLDPSDLCPRKPEPKNGVLDEDGCPDEDADSDKIPDVLDRCPQKPETVNGKKDQDGCPD